MRKPQTNPECTADLHGSREAYKRGCACPEAREVMERRRAAKRERDRRLRAEGKKPSWKTRRTDPDCPAERHGTNAAYYQGCTCARAAEMHQRYIDRQRDYWRRRRPQKGHRNYGRVLPEDGIVDHVAVERLAAGDSTIRFTLREQHEAILLLRGRGYSPGDIGRTLGMSRESVEKRLTRAERAA